MKSTFWIYTCLLLVTVIWGGSFAAIKHLLEIFTPSELLAARFLPAFIIFATISLIFFFDESKRIIKNDLGLVVFIALIGTPGYHLALNYGETQISAGLASLIIGLNPSLTFILSMFLIKEKPKIIKLAGLIISFMGLFILVRYGSGQSLNYKYILAVFITFLSPLCWAFFTVTSKQLTSRYNPITIASVATAIGSIPCMFFMSGSFFGKVVSLESTYILSLGFLSILATVVGVIVWMWGIGKISPTKTASFVYLVPFFAVIIGVVMLGESLNLIKILGGLLIMGGVYITNRKTHFKKRSAPAQSANADHIKTTDSVL